MLSEQELVSCDGQPADSGSDDDDGKKNPSCHSVRERGLVFEGICPRMFSNVTKCDSVPADSADECCAHCEAIPCAGQHCPQTGWTFTQGNAHPDGSSTVIKEKGNCTVFTEITSMHSTGDKTITSSIVPSTDPGSNGCGGGSMDQAFEWLVQERKGLLLTEHSYPYTAGDGQTGCCMSPFQTHLVNGVNYGSVINNWTDVEADEDALAAAVATHGPISIAVDASHNWQTYKSGVLTNCTDGNKPRLDHGVLLVGYTPESVVLLAASEKLELFMFYV